MLAYLVRRTLFMVLTLLAATYVIYFFTTQAGIDQLHHLTFSTLLPPDYLIWLHRILAGDWGYSNTTFALVTTTIQQALPVSLLLLVPAFVLQEILAITLGLWAGSHYRSGGDRLFTSISFVFASIPQFWLAVVVIIFFSVQLNWFPFVGLNNLALSDTVYGTPDYWAYFHAHTSEAIIDIARHLALPVILLGIIGAAGDGQIVRLAMVEALNQEHIRAARARGLRRRVVLWKHAFRNALAPLITNIGLQLPGLVFLGAMLEYIFRLPGLGELFINAGYNVPGSFTFKYAPPVHDYQIISIYFLLLAFVAVFASLLTDIGSALVDPRLRSGSDSFAPVAISPTWSTRRFFQMGKVPVTSGKVVVGGLSAVVLFAVGMSVVHWLTPPPAVSGEWIGQISNASLSQPYSVYLSLQETQHGVLSAATISGTATLCGAPTTDMVSGTADSTVLNLEIVTPEQTIAVSGSYGGSSMQLALTGQSAQVTQGVAIGADLVTMSIHPGTHAQFLQTCKVGNAP